MNKKDIVNALKQTLDEGSLGLGIEWPNVSTGQLPDRPYLGVGFEVAARSGGTLKGNEVTREVGRMIVQVVTERAGEMAAGAPQGEDAAYDHADSVAALFPEGLRLSITGGQVVVTAPPEIRGGFPDESDWRVPVVIRYQATST